MYDMDYDEYDHRTRLSSPVKAALIGAIAILVVHGITYFTGGLGIIVSSVLFTIIYMTVGFLAAMFDEGQGVHQNAAFTGAAAGLILWLISIALNMIFSLLLGAPTLGFSLLLGSINVCICGSIELFMGVLVAMIGGYSYGLFFATESDGDDDLDMYI